NNKQLDDFIKKSQKQTRTANDAYLEWIPFEAVADTMKRTSTNNRNNYQYANADLYGLPTNEDVELIPFDIPSEIDIGSIKRRLKNILRRQSSSDSDDLYYKVNDSDRSVF